MTSFARHGIERLSPSSLNVYAAQPALWVLERLIGRKGKVGASAHRGTAVEEGVCAILQGRSHEDATAAALGAFDRLTALSGDHRRDKERAAIPAMIASGAKALESYGAPTDMQKKVSWQPDGLPIPIIGYYDLWYEDRGLVVDLKTTHRIPSAITNAHARQLGFYAGALGDNVSAGIAYTSTKDARVVELENARAHRDALANIARRLMAFLDAARDADHAASMVAPDIDSFWWSDPDARRAAYEVFGV